MDMNASLQWINGMEFVSDNRGHKLTMDASTEHGGQNKGPSPKELVLDAMMGCTAIDVISILKKMRQEITGFEMQIGADKTLEHPVHFKSASLRFSLEGNIEPEKAIKAVESSLTKYCGVNYMISKTCKINFHLEVNGRIIKSGSVNFVEPVN